MRQLAELVSVTPRAVSGWENGEASPRASMLKVLAEVLSVSIGFFKRDTLDPMKADSVSFRALSSMTARERDQALAAGSMAFELDRWLFDRYGGPIPDVPDLTSVGIESASEQIRAMWKLGDRPIKNVLHLLEAHGVHIYSLVNGTRRLDAYATWLASRPFIFLNTEKSAERVRFDLAHELGHLLLHKGRRTAREKAFELEADRFSALLLMPTTGVLARIPRRLTLDFVISEKKHWSVPALSYTQRLHDLGLLSDWQYRRYCVELTQLGYRVDEPDGAKQESSLLLEKVFAVAKQQGLSAARIARDLDWTHEQLSELVFGLALTAFAGDLASTARPSGHLKLI